MLEAPPGIRFEFRGHDERAAGGAADGVERRGRAGQREGAFDPDLGVKLAVPVREEVDLIRRDPLGQLLLERWPERATTTSASIGAPVSLIRASIAACTPTRESIRVMSRSKPTTRGGIRATLSAARSASRARLGRHGNPNAAPERAATDGPGSLSHPGGYVSRHDPNTRSFLAARSAAPRPRSGWAAARSAASWDTLAEESVPGRRLRVHGRCGPADRPVPLRRRGHRRGGDAADRASRSSTGCSAAASSAARSRCSAVSRASARAPCMLQALARMAAAGAQVLLVTAEESKEQVRLRAERLGALHPNLLIVAETSLPHVLTHVAEVAPDVLAVDSIQTVADPDVPGRPRLGEPGPRVRAPPRAPGQGPQHPHAARRPRHEGRRHRRPAHARAHRRHRARVRGRPAPRAADAARAEAPVRLHARARPVRDGGGGPRSTSRDPSTLFLADRRTGLPGSVVTAVLEGARPVLVEVQALVTPTRAPMPRRSSQGLDANRLTLLLAVLDARAGLPVADADVYASVAGGIRVTEAGADLAVAIAVASARRGRPVAADLVAVGEIGLGGEVRQAAQTPRRLAEAARLGFRYCDRARRRWPTRPTRR